MIIKSAFLLVLILAVTPPVLTQGSQRDAELARANQMTADLIVQFEKGEYKKAMPLARKVVEIRERFLSQNDDALGAAYTNLGQIYFKLGKDTEAEQMFKKALAVYESKPAADAIRVSNILDKLGYLRFQQHDYETAEGLYMRSLQIKEKELGSSHAETIAGMKNFACLNLIARGDKLGGSEEKDEAKRVLKARAACWLNGFKDDCAIRNFARRTYQGVLNGRAIKLVQPPYPISARKKHLSGRVFVAVVIGEDGSVIKSKALCGGYPELQEAAVAAANSSTFSPTQLDGHSVQVTGVIIYNFIAQ